MKIKSFLLIAIAFLFMGSAPAQVYSTPYGQKVELNIPITLAKAATNYSEVFDLEEYLPYDSTSFFPVLWQCNDTAQITISLQVENTSRSSATYNGSWTTVATFVTHQLNAGNDTLYVYNVFQRGNIASGVLESVSMGGKVGNKARIVVAFANGTTVGNSGQFRLWALLPKRSI